jgi:molybdenum cofactor guanylyltransferase
MAENCYDSDGKYQNHKKYNTTCHGVPRMIAAIQAGGRSSRMKEDKSWLQIDGRPMIEHVLAAAHPTVERLVIVIHPANPLMDSYQELAERWQAELLFDEHDYRGPLGGIETVLRQCSENESAFILACDMPFLSPAFLQLLQQIHQPEKCDLTVPLDEAGHPQMLAAIYAASCLPVVQTMLVAHELKARLLPERVAIREVRFAEYAHLPNARRLLMNVNTPEDYRRMAG